MITLEGDGPWHWASEDGKQSIKVERTMHVWRLTHTINGGTRMVCSTPLSHPCSNMQQEANALRERIERGEFASCCEEDA